MEAPAQPRCGIVDADGILRVLGTEVLDVKGLGRRTRRKQYSARAADERYDGISQGC